MLLLRSVALDVTLHACGAAELAFPRILSTLNVSALDVCKMIESYSRHARGILPPHAVWRLHGVQEAIVEEFGWAAAAGGTNSTPGLSGRVGLFESMSSKTSGVVVPEASASTSQLPRSDAAGELILFTVTVCANPANDLTCPPSYINI